MVYLFNTTEKITADIKEIYRYSGYNADMTENPLKTMVLEIKDEIEKSASFKLCYTKTALNENTLDFGFGSINSKSLARNLKNCSHVYIFAATIGIEIDRIINRYSSLSPAKAVIAQGCGAALIESLCNCFATEIALHERKNGFFLRPRFSPGYGDFDIKYQHNLLACLDAPKRAGITLTDSLMMLPSKSVTAVMGVSKTDINCIPQGCELCNKENCLSRRG